MFISRPRPLNEVHQERLFSMMGITQSDGVRFSPLVDTVIAAELTDDQTLRMNVYDVKADSLKLTETISLSMSTEALKSKFRMIMNKLPVRKSETSSMSTAELDVLAKTQARRLVRFADDIGTAQDKFESNAVARQARAWLGLGVRRTPDPAGTGPSQGKPCPGPRSEQSARTQ